MGAGDEEQARTSNGKSNNKKEQLTEIWMGSVSTRKKWPWFIAWAFSPKLKKEQGLKGVPLVTRQATNRG